MSNVRTIITDRIRGVLTSYSFLFVAFGLLYNPTWYALLLTIPLIGFGALQTIRLIPQGFFFGIILLVGYLFAFFGLCAGGYGKKGSDQKIEVTRTSHPVEKLRSEGADAGRPAKRTTREESPVAILHRKEQTHPVELKEKVVADPMPVTEVAPDPIDPKEAEPQPPPVPSEPVRDIQSEIRSFVSDLRAAEAKRELWTVMAAYAPSVTYFEEIRTQVEVRQDKEEYFERWPVLDEKIELDSISAKQLSEKEWRVSFPSDFRVESAVRDAWFSGHIENEYIINFSTGRWLITSQTGSVSDTAKGSLRSASGNAPSSKPSAEAKPVPAPAKKPAVNKANFAGVWDGRLPPADGRNVRLPTRFRIIVSPDLSECIFVNEITMNPFKVPAKIEVRDGTLFGSCAFNYQRSNINVHKRVVTFKLTPDGASGRATASYSVKLTESRFPTNKPEVTSYAGNVIRTHNP